MPWVVWREIHETGNITLVCKSGEASILECLLIWYDLKDEYIKKFGLPEDYEELLKAKKRAVIKMAQYLQSGDRFLEFESKMLLLEIEQMEPKKDEENKINLGIEKAQMQERLHFRIDETWSVDDYYEQKEALMYG